MRYASALIAVALVMSGCSKAPDTTEAVKEGIIRDLTSKVDVKNMDVQVAAVTFRGSQADASVVFSPKGQPGAGMTMKYTLEKKDDGWHILRRQGDAAAHGGGAMPGAAGGGMSGDGGGVMPPNHPQIDRMPPATKQ